jgi:hypothetical protein
MPALGFDRWQRKDINASIAYGSKFATVASRNRIKKMAGFLSYNKWLSLTPHSRSGRR